MLAVVLSPTSESTASESMRNLSRSSIKSSAKLLSNNAQTLHCNSEHEEQYSLYKKRKLLQETGIKILSYIFIFLSVYIMSFFFLSVTAS